jgi:hypothetical protein
LSSVFLGLLYTSAIFMYSINCARVFYRKKTTNALSSRKRHERQPT